MYGDVEKKGRIRKGAPLSLGPEAHLCIPNDCLSVTDEQPQQGHRYFWTQKDAGQTPASSCLVGGKTRDILYIAL